MLNNSAQIHLQRRRIPFGPKMDPDDNSYRDDDFTELVFLFVHVLELAVVHALLPEERVPLHSGIRARVWLVSDELSHQDFRLSFRMNRQDFRRFVDHHHHCLLRNETMAALRDDLISRYFTVTQGDAYA